MICQGLLRHCGLFIEKQIDIMMPSLTSLRRRLLTSKCRSPEKQQKRKMSRMGSRGLIKMVVTCEHGVLRHNKNCGKVSAIFIKSCGVISAQGLVLALAGRCPRKSLCWEERGRDDFRKPGEEPLQGAVGPVEWSSGSKRARKPAYPAAQALPGQGLRSSECRKGGFCEPRPA